MMMKALSASEWKSGEMTANRVGNVPPSFFSMQQTVEYHELIRSRFPKQKQINPSRTLRRMNRNLGSCFFPIIQLYFDILRGCFKKACLVEARGRSMMKDLLLIPFGAFGYKKLGFGFKYFLNFHPELWGSDPI